MKTNEQSTIERLFSLDALRGLDMILLTVVGPLVFSAQKCWGCFPDGFMRQFNHGWECFTLWDIIMPLFIFMCGAAVPFALERRLKEGTPQGPHWWGREWWSSGVVPNLSTFPPFHSSTRNATGGTPVVPVVGT